MTEPAETLARHASSFHVASRLLRRRDAYDVAILYAFCRHVDDLADESATGSPQLAAIAQALDRAREAGDYAAPDAAGPEIAGVLELAVRRRLPLTPLATLVASARADAAGSVEVGDQADLTRYCYGVAGTVGELMGPLLGADPDRARRPAIALGIAMQMTNIARDVLEDARRGRCYLPATWIGDLPAAAIAAGDGSARERVPPALERLLGLAETYYGLAARGIPLLPRRNRAAIRVAASLYRAIGLRLRARGCDYLAGRTCLSTGERYWLAARTLCGLGPQPRSPEGPRGPAPSALLVALLPELGPRG